MSWFAAVLVVECNVPDSAPASRLFDRQIRLIQADSPDAAYTDALSIGESENASYQNAEGHVVTWRFVGLHDLAEVMTDGLKSGVEIWSLREQGDAASKVVEKSQLTAFWVQANEDKTAAELLDLKA
ncbi:MAG TPA: DUF4288 domain-containing protein [Burkholderiales bacterium]|jgi:hypothetical protein